MEFVSIIGVFRRRRLLVLVGLVASVTLGAVAGGVLPPGSHTRAAHPIGEAVAQVAIDRRVPLIATTARGGVDTIVQQSVLLATFMGSDAMTGQIAKRAGLPEDKVAVVVPTLPPATETNDVFPNGQLSVVAAAAPQAPGRPYVIEIAPNYTVPIVQIGTIAPTRGAAVSLAQATVATLRAATVLTHAAPQAEPGAPRGPATGHSVATTSETLRQREALAVRSLGPVSSAAVQSKTTHLRTGAAAAAGLFALWCLGLLFASALRRMWAGGDHPVTTVVG